MYVWRNITVRSRKYFAVETQKYTLLVLLSYASLLAV
jgi:hypothetical protein